MTPAQMRGETDRAITLLFKARVAIESNPTLLLHRDGDALITWSGDATLSTAFRGLSSFEEYRESLRRRWFSAILFDGAILQFSYTFSGDEVKKHRLCFMPCPIHFDPSELADFSIGELLEVLDSTELMSRIRLEGSLRFDYDPETTTADHPASHLTISRSSCRIPVSAPLSLGHFVRFVFQHFYPDAWNKHEAIRAWACSSWDACLGELETDRLFVDWKRG